MSSVQLQRLRMIASLQPPRRTTSKSISPSRDEPQCAGCQTAAVRIKQAPPQHPHSRTSSRPARFQLEIQLEKLKMNEEMRAEASHRPVHRTLHRTTPATLTLSRFF